MRFLAIALVVVGLDQISKALVLRYLAPGMIVPLVGRFAVLARAENRGAAFGFLRGRTDILILIALVTTGIIVYYYRRVSWKRPFLKVGLVLAFAGAAGNLIDRFRFGHVIDFVAVSIWPVFNIADAAIVTGVTLIVLHLWLPERER